MIRLPGVGGGVPKEVRAEIEVLAAEFEDLQAFDAERLGRYRTYRDEIESSRRPGSVSDTSDYGRVRRQDGVQQRHRINLPFGQALTVKHGYRVAGRLPDVAVPRRDNGERERHRSRVMERVVWGVIEASGGEQQFASGAWDGSQVGACAFDILWGVDDQMPRFRAIDPATVLVVPGVDDPHDFDRVYRFWQVPLRSLHAEYGEVPFRESGPYVEFAEPTHRIGLADMATLVEMTDRRRTIRFCLGGCVPLAEVEHGDGPVPLVVIPNLGPERDIWGWGDYEFVRDVVAYIPLLFSREADVVRASAGGAYMDKQSGQAASVVKQVLAEGGILPVKRETSSIEPILGPQMPVFLPEHAQKAVEFLKMLGFAPDAAWGYGAAGSGSDRSLQLQPLLELTAMKQINWASGLGRLFDRCFRMIEQRQVGRAVYRGSIPRGGGRDVFTLILGPGEQDFAETDVDDPEFGMTLPRSPKELFDKDYRVLFSWQNRIDPEDPAFVTTELNKFQQGVQSLQTTLERLGSKSPEDEMRLIEEEAERFPWIRQGQIALIRAQLQAQGGGLQGEGGGADPDPLAGLFGASEMMGEKDGRALDLDAGIEALGGGGVGVPFGGA